MRLKNIASLTGPHHQVSQELRSPNLSIDAIKLDHANTD